MSFGAFLIFPQISKEAFHQLKAQDGCFWPAGGSFGLLPARLPRCPEGSQDADCGQIYDPPLTKLFPRGEPHTRKPLSRRFRGLGVLWVQSLRSPELLRRADIALRPDRARAETRAAPRGSRAGRNPRVLISPAIGSHPPPIPSFPRGEKRREGRG